MVEAILHQEPRFYDYFEERISPFNVSTAARMVGLVVFLPWDADIYASLCSQLVTIIGDIKPDITLIDPFFNPGWTVSNHMGHKSILLSPNTFKEFAMSAQPVGQLLCKYPAYVESHLSIDSPSYMYIH